MNKTIAKFLIAALVVFLGYKQYKFDIQLEWWTQEKSLTAWCDRWETMMPAMAKAQLANKEITQLQYADWMVNLNAAEREACWDAYENRGIDPELPYTKEWHEHLRDIGANDIQHWIMDHFKEPFAVMSREAAMEFDKDLKPTVLLKHHWYHGGPAKCTVMFTKVLKGVPFPFAERRVYSLHCQNDYTKEEGLGGFIAVSTSTYMEEL